VLCVTGTCGTGAPLDFTPVHRGRRAAGFKREIKLLADVVWSETEARLERGVLTIRMRKDVPEARALIPIRLT
jgi:HSP20 family molecular chaperone IbpA